MSSQRPAGQRANLKASGIEKETATTKPILIRLVRFSFCCFCQGIIRHLRWVLRQQDSLSRIYPALFYVNLSLRVSIYLGYIPSSKRCANKLASSSLTSKTLLLDHRSQVRPVLGRAAAPLPELR
jgi:hypothetical protein